MSDPFLFCKSVLAQTFLVLIFVHVKNFRLENVAKENVKLKMGKTCKKNTEEVGKVRFFQHKNIFIAIIWVGI